MKTRVAIALLLTVAAFAPANGLQRIKYNHPGLKVDLGVGLWAWPLPMDYDNDGDWDLVVSCPDVPYNGTYLFENPGGAKMPIFKPAKRLGPSLRNVTICYPLGKPHILTPGKELLNVHKGDLKKSKKIYPKTQLASGGRIRANQWSYVDYDGNGILDLIVGHGLWGDYGWDNAYNAKGQWTNGPLHGHVYLLHNQGTNQAPKYKAPVQVMAGGKPVDVFGMPSPQFADFDGDGDLDLLCGDFIDGFTYFQNTGTRQKPRYAKGQELMLGDGPLEMPLCMIVVSAIDWDKDGDIDLVVGQEDGRVALVEHTGKVRNGTPVFAEPQFFQQEADEVKFGALVTPFSFDWDADGDEDLICGNTAGEIGFIENLGGNPPKWAAPKLLQVNGKPIRIMAGANGSIQGPAERKWGYTTLSVADWNHNGLPDIVVNSIWGKVVWYENKGTRKQPKLSAAKPVEVQWKGKPYKPEWNWWDPKGNELATQWRTTPVVVDWNNDGLNDLIMLDHEGYLAFFARAKVGRKLILKPGERIFEGGTYNSRHQAQKAISSLLRLNKDQAGRSGRRKLCIIDWNRDGRKDLIVNSINAHWLENLGNKNGKVQFKDRGAIGKRKLAGHTTSPTTVDWNKDAIPELLLGGEDGFLYYRKAPR